MKIRKRRKGEEEERQDGMKSIMYKDEKVFFFIRTSIYCFQYGREGEEG